MNHEVAMNQDRRLRLENLLDREIEAAHSLAAALAAEKAELTGDSPSSVEQRAAEKMRLFSAIEKLEQERRSLWEDPSAADVSESVVLRWRSLMTVMARCRTANELNGHIIRVRQHQIRQLIDIVRGKPAAITYDPQGKTFAKALRALARA
jgi:flagellar biosynthesis/type III secretory pathway chaperone